MRRPGRRAQSRAQPHMGTLPWLSCRWHWKMKAISELAELWRGLQHSSIWALGLFVHSLTSLKRAGKWAKVVREELGRRALFALPFLQSRQTQPASQNTPTCTCACVRTQWDARLFVSGIVHFRSTQQTTIYGEIIKNRVGIVKSACTQTKTEWSSLSGASALNSHLWAQRLHLNQFDAKECCQRNEILCSANVTKKAKFMPFPSWKQKIKKIKNVSTARLLYPPLQTVIFYASNITM